MREDEGRAAFVLRSSELTVPQVRSQVIRIVGTGTIDVSGQIPFTPRSKTILERAVQEAAILTHDYVGTEHILLGLARENDGVAARVLRDLGVTTEAIISRVTDVLPGSENWGRGASLPNDLLAPQPLPPAAFTPLDRRPSDARTDELPGETVQREHPDSPGRRSALNFEHGPATAETRQRIHDRCGFKAQGDKVAASPDSANALTHVVFLRVTEAKDDLTERDRGLATFHGKEKSPTANGRLPYRIQSGTHLVADDVGLRAVIRDPLEIDGTDVRPGIIAGLAVTFRDVGAIEVEFCEVDAPTHRDELRDKRQRAPGIAAKSAWQLTLRGHGGEACLPFTIEIELDEFSRSWRRKAREGAATAFYRSVGSMWAASHLQRDDLTEDQRTRLVRIEAGDWDHVVTWIRAIDSGSFQDGHEDDLVHTEWLLASLDPPINGTLGFDEKP
jgi:hypothetical protein